MLRTNFTFLKRRLENRVPEMESYLNQFLKPEEILRVVMIPDPGTKTDRILRYVSQRNERERESFLKRLIENNYLTEKDLQGSIINYVLVIFL